MSALGWAYLRLALGIGHMSIAVVAFAFLIRDGISPPSVGCFVAASILTMTSVLLSGSQGATRTRAKR